MGDASFTTVNDVPSTIIGRRVAGFTRPFSTKTRGESFSMLTVRIARSFNLHRPFYAKSLNLFESWMRKGRDDFKAGGALHIEISELGSRSYFRLSVLC